MTAFHFLCCDTQHCEAHFGPGRSVGELRADAHEAGWKRASGDDRCPVHANRKRGDVNVEDIKRLVGWDTYNFATASPEVIAAFKDEADGDEHAMAERLEGWWNA